MQKTLDRGFYKGTGSIVKVIEVRSSFKLIDGDEGDFPLVTWMVVAYNTNGYIHEVHQYDKPIKAQRKFERLIK